MLFGMHPEFPYKTKVSFNTGQLLSASEASAVFTQNLLELCLINSSFGMWLINFSVQNGNFIAATSLMFLY